VVFLVYGNYIFIIDVFLGGSCSYDRNSVRRRCVVSIKKLSEAIINNEGMMKELELIRSLQLPDWCVAAGYVRNFIWDHLHGYAIPTPLNDIDIIYYDQEDIREDTDKIFENTLNHLMNKYNWSVKNQARMHLRNHEEPYKSIADAMKRWPETATAVGIRLDADHHLDIIAPHGLSDLFNLYIRQSPYFINRRLYLKRIHDKNWLKLWPKLQVIDGDGAVF
jgi:hypothetical protein